MLAAAEIEPSRVMVPRTPDGQLPSERSAVGTYYYLPDALGSVMALTNSAGSVVNSSAYDPYGAMTASSGSTANPFGYGGQYLDRASGLYKMGQRYYDPTLARWSAQDLLAGGLENPQSLNRYASVLGNPVNLLDASGLATCGFFAGLCNAVGSGASSVASGLGQAGNYLYGRNSINYYQYQYGFSPWHCGAVTTVVAASAAVAGVGSFFVTPFTFGAATIVAGASTVGGAAQLFGCATGLS